MIGPERGLTSRVLGTGTFAGNLSANIRLVFFGLQENADLFKADTSSQIWQNYVEYIHQIVLDGFNRLTHKSLELLLTNMVPDVRPGLPCCSTPVLCVLGVHPCVPFLSGVFCSVLQGSLGGILGPGVGWEQGQRPRRVLTSFRTTWPRCSRCTWICVTAEWGSVRPWRC